MSNTFDKLSVLDSFIEEVNSYLPEIESNLQRLAQSPDDIEALEETYRRTHTIGGSASMMDFPGLAHVAHGMEDILGDVLDGLTTLNPPTIELLQRSLERMRRLLQGIRGGVDEDAVMAEDDADYVQYRALMGSSVQAQQSLAESTQDEPSREALPSAAPEVPDLSSSALPSLDEVLASFRTPSAGAGEEVEWPEEAAPLAHAGSFDQPEAAAPAEPESLDSPSALEILAAGINPAPAQPAPPATPMPALSGEDESPTGPRRAIQAFPDYGRSQMLPQNDAFAALARSFTETFDEVREEAESIEAQASSLKEILNQLRAAVSVIEAQRAEFKGFLDGSKDALDRMEDWAGKAMGLNLRNSPEHVRRYLPLSVMWVANTKLKKVLELLTHVTSGVEMTDEQIEAAVKQLSASVAACGEVFLRLQNESPHVLAHKPGWSPWEVQVSRDAEALHERVTFERHGDPSAIRAEIEAAVREALRHEYEERSLSLAVRAELERQIREEIRQEFETQRQLHDRIAGSDTAETLQEIETRLRNEIEIQVRQEFLEQIAGSGIDLNPSIQQKLQSFGPPLPRSPYLAGQAQAPADLTNLGAISLADQGQEATSMAPPQPVGPLPAQAMGPGVNVPSSQKEVSSEPASSFAVDEEAAEIFRLEAEEHLQTISMHVAALQQQPENRDLIQGIRRATHTLKGAAGMMGFRAIADLAHISEDLLDSIMEGSITISSAVLSLILETTEVLESLITQPADPSEDEAKVQALRSRYADILGTQHLAFDSLEQDIDIEEAGDESLMDVSPVVISPAGLQSSATPGQSPARGDLSVRVRLQKLDELVNLFGELLVNRSILEERIERLMRLVNEAGVSSARLRDVGQKLESRFEAATLPSGRTVQVMPGMGTRPAAPNGNRQHNEPSHLAEFDELELDRYTEFHQLTRGLSEGISDMTTLSAEMEAIIRECEGVFARESRLSTTFQDRLMKARLVPLSTMAPRLYRTAQVVALKQHKEFELMLEGEETEVDRTVYEEIAGPLLHLVRNAVNHAIESPEVREQKGKPRAGLIKLSARYEGNQVVITIRDDGIGIDPERIRRAAVARGMIRPDQPLSESDLIDLIFRPGFSTSETLSEESGRGVGLDVVRDSVSRLRGTLEVESMPGEGTAFTMKFPTSLAIQSTMMVMAGGQQFAIPTVVVEAIGRLDGYKRTIVAGQPAVVVQNELYPLQVLAQLLSLPSGQMDEKSQVLLVNAGGHRVALVVDEIKNKMDVVMKNLGPHLRHVRGVAGGTVMGNGRVVLILELSELLSARPILVGGIASPSIPLRRDMQGGMRATQAPVATPSAARVNAGQQSSAVTSPPAAAPPHPERAKYVLVVDDSPSVRRVVGNMLKQHGWEVQVARDGVEALEMISRETPAAVLLDIEMPRMDGYELIATVRAQEQYRTLPLVILTSRAASKHQQRAMQLGASSYVVKPYQDEELINTLNALVYGAAAR